MHAAENRGVHIVSHYPIVAKAYSPARNPAGRFGYEGLGGPISAGATSAILPQVLGVFSQHPPLLSKLSKCPTYFLIKGAKRLLGTVGGTLMTFFSQKLHAHWLDETAPGFAFKPPLQIKTVV